jgi:hypothetical protein
MLPELSIERIFRRELDSLPLPPQGSWTPNRTSTRRSIPLAALVVAATVVLVVGAAITIREAGDAAATGQRRVTTAPLLNVPRPTCLRGGCNVYRSDAFGYGIVLPENWRVAPPVPGATAPTGRLDRVEFTSQTPDEWTRAFGVGLVVPWDVVVEVRERREALARDVAQADGCGASPCVAGETTLSQSPAYVASWPISPSLRMNAYYVERGDRMLVLRYVTEVGRDGPHGVTERALQQIVDSISLD